MQSKALDKIYHEYNQIQNRMYELSLSEDQDEDNADQYIAFEEQFNDASLKLSMLLDNVVPKPEQIVLRHATRAQS